MTWLERARREIGLGVRRSTAVRAKRNPTAVMAVPHATLRPHSLASTGRVVPDSPAVAAQRPATNVVTLEPGLVVALPALQLALELEARGILLATDASH